MNSQAAHGDTVPAQPQSVVKDLHDLKILRTILKHGDQYHPKGHAATLRYLDEDYEHGPNAENPPDIPGYTFALLQAVISQHPENVITLLSAGANPNGLSLPLLSQNAAGFLRLGPHFAERQDFRMEDLSVFNRQHLLTYIHVPRLSLISPK
ncbi:MAG: hypothetical protein Q9184_004689 [Pyrenodesmia sp. 2 TL-2023]